MSDHELIPDPKKLQRLMANINRAREIVPDNPAGLKGYILQWILHTAPNHIKLVFNTLAFLPLSSKKSGL